MGRYDAICTLALVMGMNVLTLARSADTEKTFEECYKESIDTYGTLQLDGYSLPPRWTVLMVVYEGTTENVTLDAATEVDRQTHAAACADVCTASEECFAFLVAFNECVQKECHLLTIGNLYELKNEERDGTTAPVEENFKQLYFKDDHPCTDGQEITFKALVYEKFVYQQLGCKELINEGDECDFEDIAYLNAHRDQICTEGTECTFMYGVLGYQINGWHDMIRTCESQETVDNATRQKEERDQRETRADTDIASGVYNELIAGVYTVPNYKTLRSKLGDTGFEYNDPILSERIKVVSSLSGADEFATADAYAWQCANACDAEVGCMGFTIVWQDDYADANMCYMVLGLIEFYKYEMDDYSDSVFVGQVFVPKEYTRCPDNETFIYYALQDKIRIEGCRDKNSNSG